MMLVLGRDETIARLTDASLKHFVTIFVNGGGQNKTRGWPATARGTHRGINMAETTKTATLTIEGKSMICRFSRPLPDPTSSISASFTRKRTFSPTIPASPRRRRATAQSPSSMATKAYFCTVATRSINWRQIALPRSLLPAALRRTAIRSRAGRFRDARDQPHDDPRADAQLLPWFPPRCAPDGHHGWCCWRDVRVLSRLTDITTEGSARSPRSV